MVPNKPPNAIDPVSPIITFAGYELNHKNPKHAPKTTEQITAISPTPGIKGKIKNSAKKYKS